MARGEDGRGLLPARENARGESDILTLDPGTLTYRPKRSARLSSIDAAKAIDDVRERVRTLFTGGDTVGEFLRQTLAPTLVYTARVAPVIASSIDDVDRVMQWGFGWELGPFELFDAIGVREVVDAWRAQAPENEVPPLVREVLDRGRNRFRETPIPPAAPGLQILRAAKERSQVIRRNAGASLVDLGDGVLCVEFHSKMNAIGGDTLEMLQAGVDGSRAQFRRAGGRQRCTELLCRRQPDAPPARGAGRQLG